MNFDEISKNFSDRDLEIIFVGPQNNYISNLSMMSNAARSFDVLAINLSSIIILIIQQSYTERKIFGTIIICYYNYYNYNNNYMYGWQMAIIIVIINKNN